MNDPQDIEDARFFQQFPDRKAHIRLPTRTLVTDKQRATRYVEEMRGEFWSLGPHDKDRRRILLWKVPQDSPYWDPDKRPILKIPFLAFADEEIADRDDVLLPILHSIMLEAKGNG